MSTATVPPSRADCQAAVNYLASTTGLSWKAKLKASQVTRIFFGPYALFPSQADELFTKLEALKPLRYKVNYLSIISADPAPDMLYGELLNPDSAIQTLVELERVKQSELAKRSAEAATKMFDATTPDRKSSCCCTQ